MIPHSVDQKAQTVPLTHWINEDKRSPIYRRAVAHCFGAAAMFALALSSPFWLGLVRANGGEAAGLMVLAMLTVICGWAYMILASAQPLRRSFRLADDSEVSLMLEVLGILPDEKKRYLEAMEAGAVVCEYNVTDILLKAALLRRLGEMPVESQE